MDYLTHVFDVDGTLIDSNGVKSEAFYRTAALFGKAEAAKLVEYHQTAGSIGREARWHYFFQEILGKPVGSYDAELAWCMQESTRLIRKGTRQAPLIAGAVEYLKAIGREHSAAVSGIEQRELEEILREHKLTEYFYGVWGGPRTKLVLLRDLWCCNEIPSPAVYYGDTLDDYESATVNGLDFVFVSAGSEFKDWEAFFADKNVVCMKDFVQPKRVSVVDSNGYVEVNGELLNLGKSMAGARITS